MTKGGRHWGLLETAKPEKNNPKPNVGASYAWQNKYDTTTFIRQIPCILVQDNQKTNNK